jgi:hypothetical protein
MPDRVTIAIAKTTITMTINGNAALSVFTMFPPSSMPAA